MNDTITGVRGDDGENEWRSRIAGDINALAAKHQNKYQEISMTVYDNVIGGQPYPSGSIKLTVCRDCSCLVYNEDVHSRACIREVRRQRGW